MADGGCGKCAKYCMFACNGLICLAGALIVGLALWALLDDNFQAHLKTLGQQNHYNLDLSKYTAALWLLGGVGAVLFALGFVGCCGAVFESRLVLGVFVALLLVLCCVQLGAAVVALVARGQFKQELRLLMRRAYANNRQSLRDIERSFRCCGVDGMQTATCDLRYVGTGCLDAVWAAIEASALVVAVVSLAVLVVELLAILCGCVLIYTIGKYSVELYK